PSSTPTASCASLECGSFRATRPKKPSSRSGAPATPPPGDTATTTRSPPSSPSATTVPSPCFATAPSSPTPTATEAMSSCDEVDLVDHAPGLASGGTDEHALVQPVETGCRRLDL